MNSNFHFPIFGYNICNVRSMHFLIFVTMSLLWIGLFMIPISSSQMPFSWEVYDEKAYIQFCEVSILHLSSVLSQFLDFPCSDWQ